MTDTFATTGERRNIFFFQRWQLIGLDYQPKVLLVCYNANTKNIHWTDFFESDEEWEAAIGSKLDARLDKIGDRAWLGIISNSKIPVRDNIGKWIQIAKDQVVTSDVGQFSRSLAKIAKRFPERFGQLSLQFPRDTHAFYVAAIIEPLG